ncbi:MAG: TetR/AcrR family transcriptional regulator [Aggregatilineales bacterium]
MARKPADQSVNRDEIIAAAADVLHRNGYDATTMKDIAAAVNLTAASLYHHFKSKDFLLISVLEIGLNHAIEQLEPIMQSDTSSTEKLRQMITTHIVDVTNNTAVGAAMVFEIRSLMNVKNTASKSGKEYIQRRDAFFERRDAFERLFRQVIIEGMEHGEFRQVDAPVVARAMLGAHNWVGVWYRDGGRLSGEAIAAIMCDTFITSLTAK